MKKITWFSICTISATFRNLFYVFFGCCGATRWVDIPYNYSFSSDAHSYHISSSAAQSTLQKALYTIVVNPHKRVQSLALGDVVETNESTLKSNQFYSSIPPVVLYTVPYLHGFTIVCSAPFRKTKRANGIYSRTFL